jgi:large subunit ribosomal protein L21
MYAIVETGGKQYRVKPGDTIAVERLETEPGEVLDIGRVLLVAGNGDSTRVGSPAVDGAVVRAEVVEHARGEKIVVFRYKSKVRYRRKTGHRQALTRIRITDILLDGQSSAAFSEPQPEPEAEPETVRVTAAEPATLETPEVGHAASTELAPPVADAAETAEVAEVAEPPETAEAAETPEPEPRVAAPETPVPDSASETEQAET